LANREHQSDDSSRTQLRYQPLHSQLLDQVGNQLKLLADRETELDDAKKELATHSGALNIATEALRISYLCLERSIPEAESLQSRLESLTNEAYRVAA
jgi:hypothetical protein